MTDFTLAQMAAEIDLVCIERCDHIRNNLASRTPWPAEVVALKRARLECLQQAAKTFREMGRAAVRRAG